MNQTLIKNWWLLVLGAGLEAIYSLVSLFMQDADGFLILRTQVWKSTIVLLGRLALASGACTIAAGIWRSAKGKSWLLLLNGLALSALGLIVNGIFSLRISFRTIALLLVVMAMSIGVFELEIARTMRPLRHVADRWVFGAAGAASVGFGLVFLGFVFRWIRLEPSAPFQSLLWVGSYFGFSAICMLVLGLRLRSLGLPQSGPYEPLPVLGNPKHAH